MTNQIYQTTGALKDKRDRRDFRTTGIMKSGTSYPEIFELEEKFLPKNQWNRGSCTSQAQAHHKERQEKVKLSARYIMAKVKTEIEQNTSYGAYTRNSFKAVNKWGVPEEKLYPEPDASMSWVEYVDASLIPSEVDVDALKHKSESYWRVEENLNDIKDVLLSGHSVTLSMYWYGVFNNPSDGVLPSFNPSDKSTGHAVEIVGWNDKSQRVKCKNSWSKYWGKNGYFYIPYEYFYDLTMDLWTSLDIPKNLPVDELYGNLYQPIDKWRDVYVSGKVLLKYNRLPTRRELNALLNYWDFESVFEGVNGDIWLMYTKMEAKRLKLV